MKSVIRTKLASEIEVGDHVAELNALGAIRRHGKVRCVTTSQYGEPEISIDGIEGDRGHYGMPRTYVPTHKFGIVDELPI